MKLPLDGLRVLDLTRLLPGPYLTMMLGDYGAEIIKIEDPEIGDYLRWREPYIFSQDKKIKMNALFAYLNRNKKSLTLNLKNKKGLEIFYQLVKTADIIIESFRPEVKFKLKIDYETIKKINPMIIYASMTGFGQDGPYKNIAAHDINYIALTGILGLTGKKDKVSSIPGTQVADLGAGSYMGLSSILLALLAREKHKFGQFLDISIYDGLISWLPGAINEYFITNKNPNKENRRLIGQLPWYNVYKTKDKKEIALGALEFKFWKNFCELINRSDLTETQKSNPDKYLTIKKALKEIFIKKTQNEWIELSKGHDCCLTPVLTINNIINDSHFTERNLIIEYDHELLGKIKQIGFHFKLSKTSGMIRYDAPSFGQHNWEILSELGYNKNKIQELESENIL